jgi:hypothetical protein
MSDLLVLFPLNNWLVSIRYVEDYCRSLTEDIVNYDKCTFLFIYRYCTPAQGVVNEL